MKKIFIPILLFVAISINAIAQKKSRKELKAEKYAFSYSYDKAINADTHAKNLSIEGQRELAGFYTQTNQNIKAEDVYSKLISTQTGVIPEDYYNYSMVLKSNGKYDESAKIMDKFTEVKPNDLRAKSYIANKSELSNLQKDNGKYTITHLDVNTAAEDFGTCYYKDKIIFSSNRATPKWIKRTDNRTGQPFLNIYVADIEKGQLKNPEVFEKKLDGKYHDGPSSFSNNGTFMAFTRDHYHDKSKDKVVELQIYFSTNKDGKWSKPVPFAFNNPECSMGQPFLTSDGNTMYFISDMIGGYGATDIYKTTKDAKGEWKKPENLGDKINTEGKEMFPYLDEISGKLYFTSNGHFGLGGLDVFVYETNGSEIGRVYNAGAPLNTSYDDFAVIIDSKTNKGYFSSNRIGGSGDDDIYSVNILVVDNQRKITGITKDVKGTFIPNTFVSLLNDKGLRIDTITTGDDGAYTFLVDSNKYYTLIGKKVKYTDGENTANTLGKELVVIADVTLLTKEEVIDKKIIPGADLGKIIDFTPIYFDLDKFNIRADAVPELKKIIDVMNKYPNMVVELGSHTDCRETAEYNQVLSNKRATSSVNYIKKRITKPERISGKGYGKSKLVNDCACDDNKGANCSEVDHQKNRRTEFIVLKK